MKPAQFTVVPLGYLNGCYICAKKMDGSVTFHVFHDSENRHTQILCRFCKDTLADNAFEDGIRIRVVTNHSECKR